MAETTFQLRKIGGKSAYSKRTKFRRKSVMACDVSPVAMFNFFYLPKKGFFIVAMMTNDFCAWNCCWCCSCIIVFLAATFSSKKLARVWIDSGESNSFGLIFLGPQSYEKRGTWVHSAQLPPSSFSCTKSVTSMCGSKDPNNGQNGFFGPLT